MNSIPYYLVVQSSGHTPSNCKYQFSIEGLFQKLKHLPSLRSAGKVRNSCCPMKLYSTSLAWSDFIGDYNGSFGMAWACRIIIFLNSHGSIWLISGHMPKNSGANWTLGPFFFSNHGNEAIFVIFMRATKHEDVIIVFHGILLLNIFNDIFLQTDHTLLILHFALSKRELYGGEIGNFKDIMVFFLFKFILLVHERDNKLDNLKEGIVLFDGVFVIESDYLLGGADLLHEELYFLFRFHWFIIKKEQEL